MILVLRCPGCAAVGYWIASSNQTYDGGYCTSCGRKVHVMLFSIDEYVGTGDGVSILGNDPVLQDIPHVNNVLEIPQPRVSR